MLHVLVVEDDPTVAEMYGLKLNAEGYHVTLARDGSEGWEIALRSMPDLLLLDMGLPKLSGVEVLERLRNESATRRLPVVILSNDDDGALVERCRKLGIVDWRLKAATTPGELAHLVDRWSSGHTPLA